MVFFETKRMAGREWDASFFQSLHEALLPEVKIVRELSPAEVENWIRKVASINNNTLPELPKGKEKPKGFFSRLFGKS